MEVPHLSVLQLNAHGRAQHVEVILLGEPLGEVQRLMRPDLAQFDRLELIEVVLLHGAPSEKRRETFFRVANQMATSPYKSCTPYPAPPETPTRFFCSRQMLKSEIKFARPS